MTPPYIPFKGGSKFCHPVLETGSFKQILTFVRMTLGWVRMTRKR